MAPPDVLQLDDLDDLDLSGAVQVPPARGRASQEAGIALVRELTLDDLPRLSLEREEPLALPSPLARIKYTHHRIAKLVAEGRKGVEIAAITGFSQSRISILQDDPAFAELVEYYKRETDAIYYDAHQRLAEVGIAVVEELAERLEDDPKQFTNKALTDLMGSAFERTILPSKGPKPGSGGAVAPVAVNVTFVKSNESRPTSIDITPPPRALPETDGST